MYFSVNYFPIQYFPYQYFGETQDDEGGDPVVAVPGVTIYPERTASSISWTTVTENDTFVASQIGLRYPDKTVSIEGTFGGATVLVVGSHDGTNYHTCHGQSGLLSFTAAGADVIIENYPYLKATHSGGSSESVTMTIKGLAYN